VSDNNWILDAYNAVPLNDAGITYIAQGGVTNLITRTRYDLENVEPDYTNKMRLNVIMSEDFGSSRDPMLVIEHRPVLIEPETVPDDLMLQHLRYTYDRVGNITRIIDEAAQEGVSTTTYTYDDLYRLKSASTSDATSTPYKRTYTYNALGNILSSDQGTFTYAGTHFANPHAPTKIGTVTYSYDKNGNLASTTAGLINTWNYRNRLVRTESPSTSPVTYAYDTNDQRVLKIQGTNRTDYIGSLYEVNGESTTKNIYLGDLLVATIEDTGTTSQTLYHHHDHLASTRVTTNEQGIATYTTDYYPYGSPRNTIGGDTPSRQYIGQIRDEETTWNYLNARYYDSARGQFLSQDPVFWEIGETKDGQSILMNPQLQNSYSYAGNNPVTQKDPSGRYVETGIDVALTLNSGYEFIKNPTWMNGLALAADALSTLIPVVPAVGGTMLRTVDKVSDVMDVRYSQRTISPKFSQDGSFPDVDLDVMVTNLQTGKIAPDSLPIIYKEVDGVRVVDNNRSAYVLNKAGVPQSKWKWQKANEHESQRIENKLYGNKLDKTGTKDIKVTKGNKK
jgi:RHS repeat-associated protein